MGALFVGVDGGGTSTRCVVADETGEIVGRGRAGGANVVSVRDPYANLLAALQAALDGIDRSRVAGGVFGLAGTSATESQAVRAWREAALPGRPRVVPDMLIAFAGATAEPDGTVLVAGTGAVGARIRAWRVVRRADGLGWLLGDEGSGVWIGRRAVTAALGALDGRAEPTALVGRVAGAVLDGDPATAGGRGGPGTPDDERLARAIVEAVYARVAEAGPAWLGTLAPVVDTAAREGDPVARRILMEGSGLLGRTARVVSEGDGARTGTGPLVLAGSLLTRSTELARLVREELRTWWSGPLVSVPSGDGAAGAAALALRAVLPDARARAAHDALIRREDG